MPAINPVAPGTAGYVDPNRGIQKPNVVGGAVDAVNGLATQREDLRETHHYFAAVSSGDTWTSNIRGIVGVGWRGDRILDATVPFINVLSTGEISFFGGAAVRGYVVIWSRS